MPDSANSIVRNEFFADMKAQLSNIQLELLKLYSADIPDQHLVELKNVMARFLLTKARDQADKIWDDRGYSEKDVEKWLNQD